MDFASSGMATIDAGEQEDGVGGLIETPEGRQRPRAAAFAEPVVDPVPESAPEPVPAPAAAEVNGHGAAPEEAKPRTPARRGRPRRTSRDGDPAAPAAVAD
jgi:hypothetical protein